MGIPDVTDTCIILDPGSGFDVNLGVKLAIDLNHISIQFPGGFTLEVDTGVDIANVADVATSLLGKVNAALMPLGPLFDIMDCLIAAKLVFDAIPSLNPVKIGAAIKKFVAALVKVVGILPPLSIPILIANIVTVLLVLCEGLRAQFKTLTIVQAKIDVGTLRADWLYVQPWGVGMAEQLRAALLCSQSNLNLAFNSIGNQAEPLNRLISIVNILCSMIGLPELPTLGALGTATAFVPAGHAAEGAIKVLDALVEALQVVQELLPV